MIHYHIHSLIRVDVDERVCQSLRDAIDFQIAYFRHSAPPAAPSRIEVYPYADFAARRPGAVHAFHQCAGGDSTWMEDAAKRCAIMRTESGFAAFADSPRLLINLLIQFLLVERGITLVHAAAAADPQGNVTLLPGPGGVGKTALLGSLVQQHGYRLLGDDVVGIDEDGQCWAFPRNFVLKAYHETVYPQVFERLGITTDTPGPRATLSLMNIMADNIPLKGVIRAMLRKAGYLQAVQQTLSEPRTEPYLAAVPVEDVLGPDCVIDRGPIQRIVFLERWDQPQFDFDVMSPDAMVNRLCSIIHHEWADHMRHFWTLGSLDVVDFAAYFPAIVRIARSAVGGRTCERMRIPDGATPRELLDSYLQSQHTTRNAA
jgi:hypothetical protein